MSFARGHAGGAKADVERGTQYTDEATERARSLQMHAMSQAGMTQKHIAKYFNVSESTVCRRLKEIPPDAAKIFEGRRHLIGL